MSEILLENDGPVGIITIARRARMNSLDVEAARDRRKAGLAMARDRSVRAVIVRGNIKMAKVPLAGFAVPTTAPQPRFAFWS